MRVVARKYGPIRLSKRRSWVGSPLDEIPKMIELITSGIMII
jgi:hypothetical protein